MKWDAVTMSIIASLIFIVVVLFNFFIALAMPHHEPKRRKDSKEK